MAKRYKSDQLVIPISLPEGLALRAVAEKFGISYSTLVRQLIKTGIVNTEDVNTQYTTKLNEFNQLNDLQLMGIKDELTHPNTKRGTPYAH